MKLYFQVTDRSAEEVLALVREADLDFSLEGEHLIVSFDPEELDEEQTEIVKRIKKRASSAV